MPAIVVEQLTKRFGKTTAVDDLSFEVPPGRITGFLGPNGAGKSTTMRCLLGLVHPSSGRATIGGRPYDRLQHPLRTVGAVLEGSSFYPGRSGRDHLRLMARLAGSSESRVDDLLHKVGLTDAAAGRVAGYSMGMKQRLGIAGALLSDPEVLVLDEPANGLDPAGIRWLRQLLRHLASTGAAVLVSSHVLAEVSDLADHVAIVRRGKLVAHCAVRELLEGAGSRSLVRSSDNGRLQQLLAGRARPSEDGGELLEIDAAPEEVGDLALENGIAIYSLAPGSRTLEEVFLEMTDETDGETST